MHCTENILTLLEIWRTDKGRGEHLSRAAKTGLTSVAYRRSDGTVSNCTVASLVDGAAPRAALRMAKGQLCSAMPVLL